MPPLRGYHIAIEPLPLSSLPFVTSSSSPPPSSSWSQSLLSSSSKEGKQGERSLLPMLPWRRTMPGSQHSLDAFEAIAGSNMFPTSSVNNQLDPTPIYPSRVNVVRNVALDDTNWHNDVQRDIIAALGPSSHIARLRGYDATTQSQEDDEHQSIGRPGQLNSMKDDQVSPDKEEFGLDALLRRRNRQYFVDCDVQVSKMDATAAPQYTGSSNLASSPSDNDRAAAMQVASPLGFISTQSQLSSSNQPSQWEQRYQELKRHRSKHGHCFVDTSDYPSLSQWVKRQRYQLKLKLTGKHSTLSDERVKALDEVGFVWNSHRVIWEQRYNELVVFRQRNGHCNVPTEYASNPALGVWVKGQRRQYNLFRFGWKSSMTKERVDRLNALGMQWYLRQPKMAKKRQASATGQDDADSM